MYSLTLDFYKTMRFISYVSSVILFFTAFFIGHAFVMASSSVAIKNQNTHLESSFRIKTIKQILYSSVMDFNYSKLQVILDGNQREPRGRMKDAKISLSPYVSKDAEFTKLFVHELAHYIDIYALVGTYSRPDISDSFYYISWQSPTVKRANQGTIDFVSGYAATNQYEDFAESFVFYIFHNETFADRALRSDAIREKYLFFANHIFPKKTFQGTDFSIGRVPSYVCDTTKISYSLQKYLYSL